jgi:hypothetical protein
MSRDELVAHFDKVAALLPDGRQFEITVVGGAPLVLLGLRGASGSTLDVDAIGTLDPALETAARQVAESNGLPTTWLNTNAGAFVPNGMRPTQAVYESAKLVVRAAHADDIFIMKMESAGSAGRLERDRGDLVALWTRCSYRTPVDAVNDYLSRIPLAEAGRDPYLEDWVRAIADDARSETHPST